MDRPTGTYVLMVDLDATNTTWLPIDFQGTFDGGGHQITDLGVNEPYGRAGAFFSTIQDAIVHDHT